MHQLSVNASEQVLPKTNKKKKKVIKAKPEVPA